MKNFLTNVKIRFLCLPKNTQIISVVVAGVILIGSIIGIIVASSHRHDYEPTVTQATCLAQGYTTYECECGEKYIDNYVAAKGHSNGQWIIDKEASCTEDGSKHQICSACEATIKTETIAKLDHTDGEWIIDKEASCTEDGSKHQVCSACDETIKTETIAKLGHTRGQWVTDKEATCTEEGSSHQVCSVCDATIKTQTIMELGHEYTGITSEFSCETQLMPYKCVRCEDSYTEKLEKIEAILDVGYWSYYDGTRHVQDVIIFNGITGGYGTYTINITYINIQGEVFTESYENIEDLNHTEYLGNRSWEIGYQSKAYATVEIHDEIGFTTIYKIVFVGIPDYPYQNYVNIYSSDVSMDMQVEFLMAHPHDGWIIDKEATCTEEGSKHYVCSYCQSYITASIPMTNHQYDGTTCKDCGAEKSV